MKKILFITGSRSDFYIQRPIINAAYKSKKIIPFLIVTGAHLDKSQNKSLKDIKKENYKNCIYITSYKGGKKLYSRVEGLTVQLNKIIKIIKNIKPNLVVAPYDREEALSISVAASYCNVAIAHLGAGDRTMVNIDGIVRHSVTKLAHIHFCATKASAERVIKLGEEKKRVKIVGHSALERFLKVKKFSFKLLTKKLNFKNLKKPYILFIQHPVSNEFSKTKEHYKISLKTIDELNFPTIIISPNPDPGRDYIERIFQSFKFKKNKSVKYFQNLQENLFVNVIRNCNLILGNSSLGVFEAPNFKIPVVNIGNRQKTRENAGNIIFVPHKIYFIKKAVNRLINDKKYRKKFIRIKNPYNVRNTSKKIIKILENLNINSSLISKKITY